MVTRRATEGPAGATCSRAAGLDQYNQYVEEPDGAQRSIHARIRLRSRGFMNNAD